MFYLGLALLGFICWLRMPRELFPTITFPQLNIVTRYGNAAPEEIENLITKPLEEAVGTVPHLKRVRSLSKEGVSLVTLEFDWGTDMGFAHLSTREKIDQLKDRLPNEAEEPIINRVNPFAQPMMIYSISSDKMPLADLTTNAKRTIKQRLEKVSGVASANLSGGQEREIQVVVDRGRLEASRVSLSAVVDSLKNTNVNYPAGETDGRFYRYLVRTVGEWKSISEIGPTVVQMDRATLQEMEQLRRGVSPRHQAKNKEERYIRVDDIAEVRDTFKEKTSYSRYNGRENISISIQKQSEANALKTAARVRRAVRELRGSLPKSIRMELVYDESTFIKDAIGGVFTDGFLGGVLAFFVLVFFLRNVNDAGIVSMAIPVSTLIIFVAMYFRGVSINMLSLAGLGLAIGNLVDNSIVVVENTARFRGEGKSSMEGAVGGAEEVGNSMVTAALTNVAVILPLLFVPGVAQQLFMDLFFASVGASLVSMIVALTLIPRLAAYPIEWGKIFGFLRQPPSPHASAPLPLGEGAPLGAGEGVSLKNPQNLKAFIKRGFTDHMFARAAGVYEHILNWALDHPKKVFTLLGGLMGASVLIFMIQEKVFMPKFDQGQFIIRLNMPVGTRLEVTDRVAQKLEKVLDKTGGVKDVTTNVGSNASESLDALGPHQAQCVVSLSRGGFHRDTDDVIAELKKELEKIDLEGAEVQYILQDSVLSSAFETSAPIVVEIKGPDLVTLKKIADDLSVQLNKVRGIYGLKSSYALPSSETRVVVDRVRAASYQVSGTDIARTALIAIKGFIATTFKQSGEETDVRVQLRPEDRVNVDDIRRITVRSPGGSMVALSEVANLESGKGPSEIKHLDQQRAIVLSANVLKRSVGAVISDVNKIIRDHQHLADYTVQLKGESAQMEESFGGLAIAMVISICLIYMIMAAEFESLSQPLIIMSTVPFCLIGVAFTLFVTFTPLSAPVILGTIILGGLVVNNGIILIDFMNQMRAAGATDLREVVVRGGVTRLRPILMTMLVSILGVLPLAIGLSDGSELSSPMATVTFGGLLVSASLSLFIVPLLYYQFETRRAARQAAETPPQEDAAGA